LDIETTKKIVAESGHRIWVSMENCPNQVVLCGDKELVDGVVHVLRQKGGICQPLPFSRAYHTPLFEPVLKPLREFFNRLKVIPPSVPLYSCMTAGLFPRDPEEIRRTAVAQWARPVRFRETVEVMHNDGARIFLEIGPRGNLTGFVKDILKEKRFLALSSNTHHRSGVDQLNHTLGLLAAHGVPMCLDRLYQRRRARRLSLDSSPQRIREQKERKGTMTLHLSLPTL
jgi:acyl transferase domain-containing protein